LSTRGTDREGNNLFPVLSKLLLRTVDVQSVLYCKLKVTSSPVCY